MQTWLKVTIGIFFSLLIILLVGGYIIHNMLTNSLPEYSGEKEVSGLKNKVEIYFDSLSVPYIFAENKEDAAFALGYLHASERMFVMDLIRRAGEGRLSEILGSETVPFDKMFRTIGIKRTAEMIEKKMDPAAHKLLEAYSSGVNQYLEENKNKYTFEFDLLNYQPEQWKPVHSLIVVRMMAWELNISWWTDFVFTDLVQRLGEEKVKEILPGYPDDAPTIIRSNLKKVALLDNSFLKTDQKFREFINNTGTHIGSNSWVVNYKKSQSGKPIIANDPHLAYSAPGKWYAAVINTPEMKVAGVSLPGSPGIVIGKNQSAGGGIAWALTNIMMDEADFYFEKLDSSNTKYFINGEWKNLTIIEDTILVRNAKPEPFEIKLTHRGPIVSGIYTYNLIYNEDNRTYPPVSMKWSGNDFSDETEAFLEINMAQNWNEFKKGVEKYKVPGQNFIYASSKGNIGYLFGGSIPLRKSNSGSFIFDGTTSENDWRGYLQRNQEPYLFNPAQNFIASANNKALKDFNYYITDLWEPSSRIERITELLNSKEKHSVKDYMKYQNDIISPYAKTIIKYILSAFKGIQINDKNLKTSLRLFEEWNYELDQYSQIPTIYLTFFDKLMKNLYKDEMGDDLYNQYVMLANLPYRNIPELLEKSNSSWWDDVNTHERETRDDIIRKSMVDALTELENSYGKDLRDWQWGTIHQVTFKHAFSGVSGLLDGIIDIGPFPIGGDGTTIFNTEYDFNASIEKYSRFKHEPFENNLGPSMRFIYDFSQPDYFYLVLTTGQSGNIFSDHYKDQTPLWLTGKYMKICTNPDIIKNSIEQKLTLNPQ